MSMAELKWYSPFVLLVGAILSFADPITDILTLVEFHRADHKTWFSVGLVFVILPCLVFPFLHCHYMRKNDNDECPPSDWLCYSFHPFAPALLKLQAFIVCFKYEEGKFEDLQHRIRRIALIEPVLESAPLFIIQLYAMSVQEEPVKIIQIISLKVSFLTLAWALTTTDEMINQKGDIYTLKVKHKVLLSATLYILLSCRLLAIAFFTVSCKWWVIGVLIFHSMFVLIIDSMWFCCSMVFSCCICPGITSGLSIGEFCISLKSYIMRVFCTTSRFPFFGLHWLRDEMSKTDYKDKYGDDENDIQKIRMGICNALFVFENFFMILLFYFSEFSNTWYSLPVTVCVCLFSVLGAIVRVKHVYFLFQHYIE